MDDREETQSSRTFSRRSFIGTTAAAASATALAYSLQPVLKTLAADSTQGQATGNEEQVFTCKCQWTCLHCQYNVVVRGGRVVRARPIPGGDAIGNTMCLRGHAHLQRIYHPDRIKYPMKRAGERGEDKWERISWEEAITLITDKWNADRERYGRQSVAWSHTSGNYGHLNGLYGYLGRFVNAAAMTTLETCIDQAIGFGLKRVMGGHAMAETVSMSDAKSIISWGTNIAEGQIAHSRSVSDAREKGVLFVTIDPNFSTTAARADKWFAPRHGADVPLVMGLMNYIISNDLHDEEFLLAHTVAPVLINPATKRYLRLSDLGIAPAAGEDSPPVVWDLATNAAVALEEAVKPALSGPYMISGMQARTAFDHLLDEVGQYTLDATSELTELTPDQIMELARIAADGPVYHYTNYSSQAYPNGVHVGHVMATLAAVTGNVGKPGAALRPASNMFPINWGTLFPTADTSPVVPMLELHNVLRTGEFKGAPFPVKSLFVAGCNPFHAYPDAKWFKEEIWDKLEFIVVVDLQMSESARNADIVLPVTHYWETETPMTIVLHPALEITEKAIDPLYEAKQDADIVRLLAARMGLGEYFDMTDDEFHRLVIDESESAKAMGITWDRLREEKSIRYHSEAPWIEFEDLVFKTPTKRMEFYIDKPVPRLDYGQTIDVDRERLPHFFPPEEAWPGTESAKKYPLIMTSERSRFRWHSQALNPWMLELAGEPILRMNPRDASSRSLEDGDYVEAFNDRGHAVVRLVLSESIRPGSVMYPKNWNQPEFKDGSWAEMTLAMVDPVGVNANFMDNRCEVRKWDGQV